ncbi:hypothetical protein SPRA44_260101 [Serratia proteamaculans]|nr:hypothetical protein SPRA44_260101 [Serratia proteamaculans]
MQNRNKCSEQTSYTGRILLPRQGYGEKREDLGVGFKARLLCARPDKNQSDFFLFQLFNQRIAQ